MVQSLGIAVWLESQTQIIGGLPLVYTPGWGFRLMTVITLAIGLGMSAAWYYLEIPALETFIKQLQPHRNSTPEADETNSGKMPDDAAKAATGDRQAAPKTDQDTRQQSSSVIIDQTVSKMETNPDQEAVREK